MLKLHYRHFQTFCCLCRRDLSLELSDLASKNSDCGFKARVTPLRRGFRIQRRPSGNFRRDRSLVAKPIARACIEVPKLLFQLLLKQHLLIPQVQGSRSCTL